MKKICMLTISLFVSALGCNNKADDRFSDFSPPDDIFYAPLDPDRLVTSSTGAQFPVDELILRMSPDTPAVDVASVVTQLGGTLVGQIPPLGIYQVRVSAETEAELMAVIDTAAALPGVLAAYENALANKLSNDACFDEEDDNFDGWNWKSRCALTEIQYFALVPIMAEFEGLSPVRVTNLEYIHLPTDQFDDAPKLSFPEIVTPPKDDGHGTITGGLMAADQGDASIGGVASTVLGDRLELVLTPESSTVIELDALLYIAVAHAGVDVVNMSFAWTTLGKRPHPQRVVTEARHTMTRAMQTFPDVLFVSAAGNEATEITEMNFAPGGIQLPNHITVGGTAWCDPLSIWKNPDDATDGSNFGPLVDIAAPGERVPVIAYRPDRGDLDPLLRLRVNGTSLSAPLVASLGAILRSIDPTLSAEQIKGYILEHSYGATFNPDGLMDTPRLMLAYPVQQLLLDMNAPGAQTLFDPDGTGETDTTGEVVHRICGGSHLDILDAGSFDFPPEGNSAMSLHENALSLALDNGEGMTAALAGMGFSFSVGHMTSWSDEFALNFYLVDEEADTIELGGITIPGSGGLTITECTIIERDGLTNMPMTVEVSGLIIGRFVASVPVTDPLTEWEFEGYFTLPMITLMAPQDLQEDLEYLCIGGINHAD